MADMRDRLIELLSGCSLDTDEDARYVADKLIAADVATVVRCRDCKHSNLVTETEDGSKYIVCKKYNFWVNPGYFCASGKKNGR